MEFFTSSYPTHSFYWVFRLLPFSFSKLFWLIVVSSATVLVLSFLAHMHKNSYVMAMIMMYPTWGHGIQARRTAGDDRQHGIIHVCEPCTWVIRSTAIWLLTGPTNYDFLQHFIVHKMWVYVCGCGPVWAVCLCVCCYCPTSLRLSWLKFTSHIVSTLQLIETSGSHLQICMSLGQPI